MDKIASNSNSIFVGSAGFSLSGSHMLDMLQCVDQLLYNLYSVHAYSTTVNSWQCARTRTFHPSVLHTSSHSEQHLSQLVVASRAGQ